ncbi:cell division protein FtsL [Cytobacillus sp. FSL W7-1323]|uniref:Cell division protein FtsL n=2 Tax=Cytobacillus TaxID=2675230 RepID=A0A248TCW4_9BACI|nr:MULTISPECIES: cell division protein FtsL [Cytobacillus]ASV66045.1 cell division protein FtsL [Cytobacillus kochii]MBD7936821.1 cell division protein FtsL [Cytobacillus stercorigallinarum]MCA1028369.1 cell division protein FtsL [Cytobacillus kochii]MCM3321809.1 cell division protein FtsL [Cytobacillus kochii]MCM3343357.1 cell division protein FtsL [Cytobacillus kochii]
MENVARKLQQEQHVSNQPAQAPKKKIKDRKSLLSPGEKIMGIVFAGAVFFGATTIISNQAGLYEVNAEIQDTQKAITEQQSVNSDLKMQIEELSRPDRVKQAAEKSGFEMNESPKVVGGE